MIKDLRIAFFGSSEFSVYVLDELEKQGILPDLIITTPDKPKGRKLVLTPTPVKVWGQRGGIAVLDFDSLKNNPDLILNLKSYFLNLFLVASYGKIIPKEIFEIPKYKTLNIHPSLLPKYRGASPIESQILNDEKEVGVTIMQIDEEMDHGPVIVQRNTSPLAPLLNTGEGKNTIEKLMAEDGAKLFAEILPDWLAGKIEAEPQNETQATYTKKIKKEDGLIDLNDDAYKNLLKIRAYEGWPTAYFFHNGKRIIIKKAVIENGKLKIERLVPEGKKEMSYEDFLRGQK